MRCRPAKWRPKRICSANSNRKLSRKTDGGIAYAVEESVLAVFSTATARQQRRLLGWFREIAAAPFRAPDYEEQDSSGRALAVVLRDDWLVTYWCDHAVGKVMIVAVVAVEGP